MLEMQNLERRVRSILSQEMHESVESSWRHEVKTALLAYLESTKSLAESCFHRIPSAKVYYKDRTFETKALYRIICRIDWNMASDEKEVEKRDRTIDFSLSGVLDFDPNAEEVWIPWHRDVAEIVTDLLRNAVYSKRLITDPWFCQASKSADMWVRVDYRNRFVEMTLANASNWDANELSSRLKEYRWSSLLDIGGKVEPVRLSQNDLIGVRVKLPYAAYMLQELETI